MKRKGGQLPAVRTRSRARSERTALAQSLVRRALANVAATTAMKTALVAKATARAQRQPRGLGPGTDLFVRGSNGQYAIDALSLNRVPRARAVRIGMQNWNSKSLSGLLNRNPRAPNPLTRQPFPETVYRRYGVQKHIVHVLNTILTAGRNGHAANWPVCQWGEQGVFATTIQGGGGVTGHACRAPGTPDGVVGVVKAWIEAPSSGRVHFTIRPQTLERSKMDTFGDPPTEALRATFGIVQAVLRHFQYKVSDTLQPVLEPAP
jgi:hypothetical protein